MDLNKALENLKHDTRMKDWNIKQGVITKDDHDKNLNALKDSQGDSVPVTLEDRDDD